MKLKISFAIITFFIFTSFGCNFFHSTPSGTIERFVNNLRNQKNYEAVNLLSKSLISQLGGREQTVKRLEQYTSSYERISKVPDRLSFEIEHEIIIADSASVTTRFITESGEVEKFNYKLSKEDGYWKIDTLIF